MLVLSRKSGERILVGDAVVITVVRIGPNTVRLGITAPGKMNIVREELCDPSEVDEMLNSIQNGSHGK
jgi:carbon storage regulator